MTTLILDIILALAVLGAVVGSGIKSPVGKLNDGAMVAILLINFPMLGCWIWLAVVTGYWQFAAIYLFPFAIRLGATLAEKAANS